MLQAGKVTALGTMSGTSLDGVDAAVIETDGVTIFGFGPSDYRAYSKDERRVLSAHLGRWPEDGVSDATEVVEAAHLEVMRPFEGIDIAGFHGQTLAHDPRGRGTHQCGSGARLAQALGYPVAWDFRSHDVAMGGQGAPLAPFYHFALAKWLQADAPLVFLNLGGVGNLTWIDPACHDPADAGALLAFDTGPANAPMNDLMMARRGEPYDADGALAATGTTDSDLLGRFAQLPYFAQAVPKSLDRDAFAEWARDVAALTDADALATLAAAVVDSAYFAMAHCPAQPAQVLVTGGGRRNKILMAGLARALDCPVKPVESVGLDGDMLEAQAFAYLAVRCARGLPLSSPQTTGVPHPVTGGRVAAPAV
ncbi:MAG: anhydro-N-acetylmuramic acid kinase [Yoonia sp.]|uniref:anhydro-N-acetylmuramic acid kinase n=1 Tax=Yoonia sp. TaxID=2212373 RepID=UPI003EF460BB